MPTFPALIQFSFGIPSQSNKIGTRNKRDSNRKGRSQSIPTYRYVIPYITDPKNSAKKY
jgi:hypothetical protein